MEHDTAGDPQGAMKWTRRTMDRVADELRALRLNVGPTTVSRLLRGMGFSLRVNHKKLCNCSAETRDQQFQYITELREELWSSLVRCSNSGVSVFPSFTIDHPKTRT